MASIIPSKKGFRAQVCVKGLRDSATFRTKREASVWAAKREAELLDPAAREEEHHTLADALERYRDEVSPTKDGERWEIVRISAFLSDPHFPSGVYVHQVTPDDLGAWRDNRLKTVTPGTVLREMGLLSAVFKVARREWRWIVENPLPDVSKPRTPDHREVLITRAQTLKMLRTMGYRRGPCKSSTHAVCVAFLLALRTGMRAGEICALRWSDLNDGFVRVAGVLKGAKKTSSARRDVPLVYQSKRLIDSMAGWDAEFIFGIKSQTLDALFRRYRDRAGLEGFTFHDSRHVAATALARRIDALTLCKMFGWKTTKQALIYYNPKADDIRKALEPNRSR